MLGLSMLSVCSTSSACQRQKANSLLKASLLEATETALIKAGSTMPNDRGWRHHAKEED